MTYGGWISICILSHLKLYSCNRLYHVPSCWYQNIRPRHWEGQLLCCSLRSLPSEAILSASKSIPNILYLFKTGTNSIEFAIPGSVNSSQSEENRNIYQVADGTFERMGQNTTWCNIRRDKNPYLWTKGPKAWMFPRKRILPRVRELVTISSDEMPP